MAVVITVNGLTKHYKTEAAVESLDFTLAKGEICALIGKNGAGKSTFFKMLSGQLQPTSGEIQLFGSSEPAESRSRIGFLIEEPPFFSDFTAQQNLEYFRIQRGVVEKSKITEVLEQVGLTNQARKKVREYSMGMKQRLGLALCLLASPDCLVLDEPTNGLDPEGINQIRQLLLELNQQKQVTILIASHILKELQLIATRYVFIHEGKLIETISQAELQEKCQKQLKLKVNRSDQAAQLLERNFPNIQYRCLSSGWISIQNHLENSAEINQLLVSNGVSISELRIEDLKLEDYFLQRIGES
ncbi:ABC transporter ATP-binding protein [Enterococcus sp. AZ072]|uniref:ABC transporter ATP-binding protein n=1 Tax=unclassified Enterococcus TaxID=2608891 RepID=UPI003D2DB19D